MEAILITNIDSYQQLINDVPLDFIAKKESVYHTEGQKFLNIHRDNGIIDLYNKSKLHLIKEVGNPNFYYLDFNSFRLFKIFVVNQSGEFLIDNDRDSIYNQRAVSKIKSWEEF